MTRRAALAGAPLLLAFGAAALGSLALFAAALGVLAVYAGSAAAAIAGVRRLRVDRTLDRHEILEGRPLTLRFATRGLRGLPVHVEVLAEGGTWEPLPGGTGAVTCAIDRPGPHVVGASPVRVRDDLGLFSRPTTGGRPEAVLVLPAPAPVRGGPRRGGANPVGDPEPDGLRPYVAGTPANRIHWAAAARGAELQERHFATARDHLPLVVVDTAGTPDVTAVDWAARVAAGHVLSLARSGGCRVLLPGDHVATTVTDPVSQWPAIHRRLAALDRDTPSPLRPELRADRDTLHVHAARAPADALHLRGILPPGVVPLAGWTAGT